MNKKIFKAKKDIIIYKHIIYKKYKKNLASENFMIRIDIFATSWTNLGFFDAFITND